MDSDFAAIDLETANPNAWSICQIGIAHFAKGEMTRPWMSYIDTEEHFNPDNVAIHGITAAAVRGYPKLTEVGELLHNMLDGRIVVSHSQFDRVALEQAFDRQGMPRLDCRWLDSTLVARRAWAGFGKRGFGLENLCRLLGYRYQRHDALADAKAAGVVVLAAIEQTGVALDQWLRLVDLPLDEGPRLAIRPIDAPPPGTTDDAQKNLARPSNRLLSPEALRRRCMSARARAPGNDPPCAAPFSRWNDGSGGMTVS